MGLQELVARTVDEYVAIALRLGGDKAYRKSIRKKIKVGGGRAGARAGPGCG